MTDSFQPTHDTVDAEPLCSMCGGDCNPSCTGISAAAPDLCRREGGSQPPLGGALSMRLRFWLLIMDLTCGRWERAWWIALERAAALTDWGYEEPSEGAPF